MNIAQPTQTADGNGHANVLEAACDFIRGVTFDTAETSPTETPGGIPILRAGNIQNEIDFHNDLLWVPPERVSSNQLLRPGDIVVCMSSGSASVVGKTCQVRRHWRGSVGAFCGIIRPKDPSDSDFLANWLRSPSFTAWRDAQARGANIQNLRFSEMAKIMLPWPPQSRRHRIAARLDEQCAAVAKARAAVQAQLEATQNLPTAYLRAVFEGKNPSKWQRKRIGDIAEAIQNGIYKPAEQYGHGLPFVRMYNVSDTTWKLNLHRLAQVDLEESEQVTFSLRKGDLLVSRVNSFELVGKCAWVGPEAEGYVFENMLIRVRLKEGVDSLLVAQQMMTRPLRNQVQLVAKRAIGQASINSEDLRNLQVLLPPLDEQRLYSATLQSECAAAESLSTALAAKLATLDHLPAALMREAFAGRI